MNEDRFQLGKVAEIIDAPPNTIKTWVQRGLVASQEDAEPAVEGGRATGTRRSFSIHAIMQMAVAKSLIDFGFRNTERAFEAAAAFAHIGQSPSGWVGGDPDLSRLRLPAMPYHYSLGRTLLLVEKDRTRVILDRDLSGAIHAAALLVDLSEVFDLVCGRLMNMTGNRDFHPSALMDSAYPAEAGV